MLAPLSSTVERVIDSPSKSVPQLSSLNLHPITHFPLAGALQMLETTLYDIASGKLVWAGTKTITDDRSDKKNMTRVIEAVIADLQKHGLIPATE